MSPAAGPRASLLEVTDLRVQFETGGTVARAVDGVSFRVGRAETVGLVGESGCGKTVTALALLGLVPRPGRILPGSSVRYEGAELLGAPARRLRQLRGAEVSMVFQEPMTSLNPVLTVGSQIAETLRAHGRAGAREARARATSLLAEVGMPDPERRLNAYPHELSGGMRQRVLIAMAVACEPALLVADEPTTALDVTVQAEILELLGELRRRRGMAVLLVSHDLGVVARVCDRILVMYAGQIVESGPVEHVFAEPRHPYTEGLLACLPRVDAPGRRLRPIPGSVPDASRWPDGCRFRERCSHAWDRCLTLPPLLPAGAEGAARCWLVQEPAHRARGLPGEAGP